MDKARYILAVLLLVSVPPSIALWYAIHPWAHRWRRLGPGLTYAVLSVPALGLGWTLWWFRSPLVGRSLGSSPGLIALAVLAAVAGGWLAVQRRKQLTQKILVGVPELSKSDSGRLLTDGIYGRTRNPRYLEFVLLTLAYVALANYSGVWVLWAMTLPALHLVVLLEERELQTRFGPEYEEYCRHVPRYFAWRAAVRPPPG